MRVASKQAYICPDCGYIYNDRTPFEKLPDKYFCPESVNVLMFPISSYEVHRMEIKPPKALLTSFNFLREPVNPLFLEQEIDQGLGNNNSRVPEGSINHQFCILGFSVQQVSISGLDLLLLSFVDYSDPDELLVIWLSEPEAREDHYVDLIDISEFSAPYSRLFFLECCEHSPSYFLM
ncbi:hypothetical protein COCNU_15G005850 [Cocos nucifera]|uniref:Rubredoxin-like domain-containing protein n=1 Tax=Cocos nucifera TaxID=13894 RepID=A0A8K0IXK8_COCNU|nr:hypothetical protein COCNU_15G005850 [Cocos nucifera]